MLVVHSEPWGWNINVLCHDLGILQESGVVYQFIIVRGTTIHCTSSRTLGFDLGLDLGLLRVTCLRGRLVYQSCSRRDAPTLASNIERHAIHERAGTRLPAEAPV